jgi:hypothetical protein
VSYLSLVAVVVADCSSSFSLLAGGWLVVPSQGKLLSTGNNHRILPFSSRLISYVELFVVSNGIV